MGRPCYTGEDTQLGGPICHLSSWLLREFSLSRIYLSLLQHSSLVVADRVVTASAV